MLGDTVAAISTPRGKGGVAMIRVSGPRAVEICENVFLPKSGKRLSQIPPRQAVYGEIRAKEADGAYVSVDDGIATVFYAPASFTGEDTVELTCHGGILLTQTVLSAVIGAGARAAEAGEFTRRAFVSGKLGLSAAEALGELLEAKTHAQMRLAHTGLRGALSARCEAIYRRLCGVLAAVYVKIDYPDEDLAELSDGEIKDALQWCEGELSSLIATYRTGHAIAEGIPTVICGRPNGGKSSLYNRIVGHDAARVTEIEGTTRDVLCETAPLGGVTLRLFDTAGLHDTEDPVERIGIDRARRALESAELILAVFDGSEKAGEADISLVRELEGAGVPVIAVINKSDLGGAFDTTLLSAFAHTVTLSAKDGDISSLTCCVEQLFLSEALDITTDAVISNARQNGAAMAALDSVRRAKEALDAGLAAELYCADAEAAMQAIAEVDGRAVSEDIVSEIFSHFCVGK